MRLMRGDTAAVRALLTQKADVNGSQGDGGNGAPLAVFREDLAIVNLLIQAGANARSRTMKGRRRSRSPARPVTAPIIEPS